MIGIKVNKSKTKFFDRAILNATDKAKVKVLSKFGAFVRRTAKGLIRKGKKQSKPGSPPKSHTGILKRFLYFVYDKNSSSVLIGPAKTNQVFFKGIGQPATGTVPSVLEYGGTIGTLEIFKWGKWRRADLRSKRRNAGLPARLRRSKIAARPYMAPALAKESPKFASLWLNTIKPAA